MKRVIIATLSIALLALAGCKKSETPPAGIALDVRLDAQFQANLVKGVMLIIDRAPLGEELKFVAGAQGGGIVNGTPFTVSVTDVDGDGELEFIVDIKGNPFVQKRFLFDLIAPGHKSPVFSFRAVILGEQGPLGVGEEMQDELGEGLSVEPGRRRSIVVQVACVARISCISASNQSPQLAAPTAVDMAPGTQLGFNVVGWDPDGDALTVTADLSALPMDSGALFSPTEMRFSWQPSERHVGGPYKAVFNADDGRGGTARIEVAVTVLSLGSNAAPIFKPIGQRVAMEGERLSFTVEAIDPDRDTVALSASLDELPNGSDASFNTSTGVFSWTPDHRAARNDPFTVVFKGDDGKGGKAEMAVAITVLDVNQAPVFSSLNDTTVRVSSTLNLTILASDTDGDTITYDANLAGLPTNHGASFDRTTRTLTWTPTQGMEGGPYTVFFKARDSKGREAIGTVGITVVGLAGSSPPQFVPVANPEIYEGRQVTLTVQAVDPDPEDTNLTYTADLSGLPTGHGASFIEGTKTFTWTPATGVARGMPYQVQFQANDGRGGVGLLQVFISVKGNRAPELNAIGPRTVDEGSIMEVTLTATDPDQGQTLKYCKISGPAWATVTGEGDTSWPVVGKLRLAPNANTMGNHMVVVRVMDAGDCQNPGGLHDEESVAVTVIRTNVPPVLAAITGDTINEGAQYTRGVQCVDNDADTLTLGKGGSDTCDGTLVDNGNGTGMYSFTASEAQGGETCKAEVTYTDGTVTVSEDATVAVTELNQNPSWTAEPVDINLPIGSSYNQDNGQASDADLPADTSSAPGRLNCSASSNQCSFSIVATGSGNGSVNCNMRFTAASVQESCSVDVNVTDGLAAKITKRIYIQVQPRTLYVKHDAAGAGTGASWQDAFTTVRAATAAARSGEMIWVARGTYTSDPATEPVLTMKEGIKVYGGFSGGESSLGDRADPSANPTILDGENQSLTVVVGASHARLDGFVITKGAASTDGGGMVNKQVESLIVTNCTFKENTAADAGGAMATEDSTLSISNCLFERNRAPNSGGGALYFFEASLDITNCSFQKNSAAWGGAIFNWDNANPRLTDCTFNENTTTGGGGAMINDKVSKPTMTRCTLTGNTAGWAAALMNDNGSSTTIKECIFRGNSTGGGGGALVNDNSALALIEKSEFSGNTGDWAGAILNDNASSLTILESTIHGNISNNGGGIYNAAASSLTIRESTIYGNVSKGSGGGIYNRDDSTLLAVNNLFYGNRTESSGGGIITRFRSNSTIINCTFSGNMGGWGGGLSVYDNSSITVTNSIVWGNMPRNETDEIYVSGSTPCTATVTYSDVKGSYTGDGNVEFEPKFANAPAFWDRTAALGETAYISVSSPGLYSLNDVIEIGLDDVPRTVVSINESSVYFAPAYGVSVREDALVENWGQGATNLKEDYRLSPISQCKDVGTATGAPDKDLEGKGRPSCSGYDLGAYEIQCTP